MTPRRVGALVFRPRKPRDPYEATGCQPTSGRGRPLPLLQTIPTFAEASLYCKDAFILFSPPASGNGTKASTCHSPQAIPVQHSEPFADRKTECFKKMALTDENGKRPIGSIYHSVASLPSLQISATATTWVCNGRYTKSYFPDNQQDFFFSFSQPAIIPSFGATQGCSSPVLNKAIIYCWGWCDARKARMPITAPPMPKLLAEDVRATRALTLPIYIPSLACCSAACSLASRRPMCVSSRNISVAICC
jgi:hypothetical protein